VPSDERKGKTKLGDAAQHVAVAVTDADHLHEDLARTGADQVDLLDAVGLVSAAEDSCGSSQGASPSLLWIPLRVRL
jgi:hypothetical protein